MSLPFFDSTFEDLLKTDKLLITAKGLGTNEILYKFIKYYSNIKSLVFVLNLSKNEQNYFHKRLIQHNNPNLIHTIDLSDDENDINDDNNNNNKTKYDIFSYPTLQVINSKIL
jgi:hypothetical protein